MHFRAEARTLRLPAQEFQTPLVVPSFSSRAKPPTPVWRFLQETLPAIAGPILVSAYDVAHQPRDPGVEVLEAITSIAPSFVLLDSGGYEVLWNDRAVDSGLIRPGSAPGWTLERYYAVLEAWPTEVPLLAVSYDAPGLAIERQMESALALAERCPNHGVELLLKPPRQGFDAHQFTEFASALADFSAIGVTEDEIGASMADRLDFIATLRDGLETNGVAVPIHVFGGLDPQMTPLYHAAGADIFDGLSWLRYAFEGDLGIYDKSYVAVEYPRAVEKLEIWEMRRRNIGALVDLQIGMTRFQTERDFAVYGERAGRLGNAWAECGRTKN